MCENKMRIRTIIRVDFNVKTGKEKGSVTGIKEEKRGRQSKDRKVISEARLLVNFIEEKGWIILTENTKRDEEGERIHVYREVKCTVIDYIKKDGETM